MGRTMHLRKFGLFALTFPLLATFAESVNLAGQPADEGNQGGEANQILENRLTEVRTKHSLPALWACKFSKGHITSVAASGFHKSGGDLPVEVANTIHLGSCTKAMTAVLIAQLVSSDKLTWYTSLAEVFSKNEKLAASEWATVTVAELLKHRSGAPKDCDWLKYESQHPKDPIASRQAVLNWLVDQKMPSSKQYVYSNVGYCLLGHIVEEIEGKAWEVVIDERLFQPLKIKNAGSGPVMPTSVADEQGQKQTVEQPWGHVAKPKTAAQALGEGISTLFGGKATNELTPIRFDNAMPLGPAGRIHMPIEEWSKFVRLFVSEEAPDVLNISQQTWDELLDTGDEGEYAGGWIHLDRPWADGGALFHNGSNTTWYCVAWLAPKNGMFCLVATNSFGAPAIQGCDEVAAELLLQGP